jgi:hypothetical protein
MRSGAYSEIPAAIKFIAQAVADPTKIPGGTCASPGTFAPR